MKPEIDGETTAEHSNGETTHSVSSQMNVGSDMTSVYPDLPPEMTTELLAETINAITAIGGHENPPARHIVGHEAVATVKEKLKTVSEELEDFIDVSCRVDIEERTLPHRNGEKKEQD